MTLLKFYSMLESCDWHNLRGSLKIDKGAILSIVASNLGQYKQLYDSYYLYVYRKQLNKPKAPIA